MGRWEPGAPGRLREAAMALYAEQGFERTTVAEIADRAGVTARTFFRYFADKREVLFAGTDVLERHMVDALVAAPAPAGPMDAVYAGVLGAAEMLGGGRDFARTRHAVITATPDLRERELIKMASLATAFADALQQRGVEPAIASLAAETGIAVFRVSFERWIADSGEPDLAEVMRKTFVDLAGLASPDGVASKRTRRAASRPPRTGQPARTRP
jgi:AcrR family transcriptional regulator